MNPNAVVITRFLGTTAKSGNIRDLLESLCLQINRVYKKNFNESKGENYKELLKLFNKTLNECPRDDKPLIIVLDSLDQLSSENFAHSLQWLPGLREPLPKYCQIIVSTLPHPHGPLDILEKTLDANLLLPVKFLTIEDGREIMNSILSSNSRTLTSNQKEVIIEAFAKTPLPLFLRLATDRAIKWRSYEMELFLGKNIIELINSLFDRIEKRYGSILVRKAFGYITAAKFGLSSIELEDILSLDDQVLDETFAHWVPPFPRIPQMLWLRIRDEVGDYLVERGVDGVMTYSWYHRQFWQVAVLRLSLFAQVIFHALYILNIYLLDILKRKKNVFGRELLITFRVFLPTESATLQMQKLIRSPWL